jgi:hypothetical protein
MAISGRTVISGIPGGVANPPWSAGLPHDRSGLLNDRYQKSALTRIPGSYIQKGHFQNRSTSACDPG